MPRDTENIFYVTFYSIKKRVLHIKLIAIRGLFALPLQCKY